MAGGEAARADLEEEQPLDGLRAPGVAIECRNHGVVGSTVGPLV